jgi:hypothetical protein
VSVETLQIVGGSRDGETMPAVVDGKPLAYVCRSSTGEVWLRYRDRLVLTKDATVEDGVVCFRGEDW